jgi:hypothetical protein
MSEPDKEICCICCEDLDSKPKMELKCTHVVHTECGFDWVASKNSCPLCRGKPLEKPYSKERVKYVERVRVVEVERKEPVQPVRPAEPVRPYRMEGSRRVRLSERSQRQRDVYGTRVDLEHRSMVAAARAYNQDECKIHNYLDINKEKLLNNFSTNSKKFWSKEKKDLIKGIIKEKKDLIKEKKDLIKDMKNDRY